MQLLLLTSRMDAKTLNNRDDKNEYCVYLEVALQKVIYMLYTKLILNYFLNHQVFIILKRIINK
jgi:hypothetical protein